MSEIKVISQLKSSISGEKGQSFFWSMIDPDFILASDIKIDDEVVIYSKDEQTFWQQKDSFCEQFPEIQINS